jgi:hypothetical protein
VRGDIYEFRIDSYTPETLPMARLAEYLAELSKVFGNADSVRFRGVKRGSAVLVSEVKSVAVPKVRDRLVRVESAERGDDVAEPIRGLNALLPQDNAVGRLRRGTATILDFPGRKAARVRIGPVTQPTTIVGQLVRVGGLDSTAHAQAEDAEGRTWRVTMTRDQARALAPHLYGPLIRFAGTGRWSRDVVGVWELEALRLTEWERLSSETLRETVTALRGIAGSEWVDDRDQLETLARIRDGEGGVH